jgi:nitrogenase subunit NifH
MASLSTEARRFAIYGKGGGGKSMTASNLSVQFARRGLRTLQIGCDPKHDSTKALALGQRIPTVLEILQTKPNVKDCALDKSEFLFPGAEGIGCIEAGGPESGTGCAGMGIVTVFRILEKQRVINDYDAVIMDVLGDVVCGGFATPLQRGFAGNVAIVVSDSQMSMYAANNVARAIRRYQRNGAILAGLVVNNVRAADRVRDVERFADRLGTPILGVIPHDERVREAERKGVPVSLHDPGGPLDQLFDRLATTFWEVNPDTCAAPTPMTDQECDDFFRSLGG